MRGRAPEETVEAFRKRTVEQHAGPLRNQLAAWIDSIANRLADATPAMPIGVTDRPAEIWEPLLAIADAAGDHWPDTARAACTHFVLEGASRDNGSLGVRLLADLRELYTARGTDRLTTGQILEALNAMDDAPWGELSGKPLDNRRLSRMLSRYGVESKNLKQPGGNVAKGYRLEDGLADAFRRYLPDAATSATAATAQVRPVAEPKTHPLPPLPEPDPRNPHPPPGSGSSGNQKPPLPP